MEKQTKSKYLLIIIIIILTIINYPFLDNAIENFLIEYEFGIVERVIDGDTIVVENESIRLLGINSPERGEKYYEEAKEYLEFLVLNNTVKLQTEKEDRDRYDRKLRYVVIGLTNINLELVKKGLANLYFPNGKTSSYNEFEEGWKKCIEERINLCEPSKEKCAICIQLEEFNNKEQEIIFYNRCGFSCNLEDWTIKDEGRKKFTFNNININPKSKLMIKVSKDENDKNTDEIVYWIRKDYVWTDSGDTLFLRDPEGKLVLWESY